MQKRQFIFLLSTILSITIILVIIGFLFNKTDAEKLNGLTEVFDVNQKDMIAFVRYEEGKPEIYIKTDNKEELAIQLSTEEVISDVEFSLNDTTLFYSVTDRNAEKAVIYALDIRSFDQKEIFRNDALITDLAIDPNDEQRIFYLKAGTFENYSPIARARPHDIDVFSFNLDTREEIQHTFLKMYAMDSLEVSSEHSAIYVQMTDESQGKTAEEIFDMKERIFKIPLDDPNAKSIVGESPRDIWGFAMLSEESSFIFQAISNEAAGGTFQYELYYYDLNDQEEKRITDVQSYAGNPVIAADGKTVYFTVNKGFATSRDDYYLYKVGVDGKGLTKIELEHP